MLRRLAPRRLTRQGAGVATGIRALKIRERRNGCSLVDKGAHGASDGNSIGWPPGGQWSETRMSRRASASLISRRRGWPLSRRQRRITAPDGNSVGWPPGGLRSEARMSRRASAPSYLSSLFSTAFSVGLRTPASPMERRGDQAVDEPAERHADERADQAGAVERQGRLEIDEGRLGDGHVGMAQQCERTP